MATPLSSLLRRAVPAALTLVALAAAPTSAAQLGVEHDFTQITELGTANGLLDAGDVIEVREGIRSSELGTLSGLNGTLSLASGGTVLEGASPWPDIPFGDTAVNSVPFRVALSDTLDCGAALPFSLALTAGANTAQIPFRVTTGAAGPAQLLGSVDVPHAVPNPGVLVSTLPVETSGRVKDIRVRLNRIDHTYTQDLTITLISPSGTRVRLVQGAGGAGDNFLGTIITDSGTPVAGGSAPFTGTYAAQGDLGLLDGEPMAGTWKLELSDGSPADAGALVSWGLELAPAICTPRPVASFTATPQPVATGAPLTLDASASTDPTGAIVSYTWDLDGNGTFETDNGADPTLVHSYVDRASINVGLRTANANGEADQTTRTISITQAPTAALSATPDTPATGQEVVLDASASVDPDGTISRYAFDADGDGTFELDGTQPTRTVSFATAGPVTVRVRVTDDNGATSIALVVVKVANRTPTASLTLPSVAVTGVPATLDAGGSSDLDGTLDHFDWDVDGDGLFDVTTQGPTLTRTFTQAGTRTIRVRAVDDLGAADTASGTLTVTVAPVAALTATPSPARPGAPVLLDALASSDPDGVVAAYAWDLDGNGSFETAGGTTATRTTSFAQEGTHTVTVRVTDDAGATDTAQVDVAVVNLRPQVVLSSSAGSVTAGSPVTFDASGSSDGDGVLSRFEWDLDGNGSFETDGGAVPTVSRAYPNPASFQVGVRVTDDDGGSAEARLPLTVTAAPTTVDSGTPTSPTLTSPIGTPVGVAPAPVVSVPSIPAATAPIGTMRAAAFAAALEGAAIQKRKTVLRRGLALGCVANRATRCALTVEVSASDAKRLRLTRGAARRKPFRVGRKTIIVSAAGRRAVAIKLPVKLRRVLKGRRSSVLVLVRAVAVDAAGSRIALTRAVLVR